MQSYGYDEATGTVFPLMDATDYSHYWCWMKVVSASQDIISYIDLDNNVRNLPIHSFPRTDSRNHKEYHVRVKLWNLTPEQYRFRKLLEENASIGGDLFSPEPGEVRGNVYCESDPKEKVYGYVNISRVVYQDAKMGQEYLLTGKPAPLTYVAPEDYATCYSFGYQPVELYFTDNQWVVGWGLARCFDCVAAGGTLEKPQFENE